SPDFLHFTKQNSCSLYVAKGHSYFPDRPLARTTCGYADDGHPIIFARLSIGGRFFPRVFDRNKLAIFLMPRPATARDFQVSIAATTFLPCLFLCYILLFCHPVVISVAITPPAEKHIRQRGRMCCPRCQEQRSDTD